MKTTLLSSLVLLWVSLLGAASATECTFDSIVSACGDLYLQSIDDTVYGHRKLIDYDTNVMSRIRRFNDRLHSGRPGVEGTDNPDVAIAYAFMHFICFDPTISPGEEKKVYNCVRDQCPRAENIESSCEGMNA